MGLAIGLTGGIASGKSTITQLFTELGIEVIDADLIARDVVLPGSEGFEAVVAAFGPGITDSHGLNRKALRNLVFSDAKKKDQLTDILHPLIGTRLLQRSNEASGPYHLLDIPLLVEGNWQKRLDRVLVVDCTREQQIERVMARDDETRARTEAILQSQASREERLAIADDVIDNSGAPEALAPQVYRLHQCYLALAHTHKTTE